MRGAGGQARWTLCIHPSAIIVSDTRAKGGGKDGEGRGESFTESNRFDSVRGPIPRTKDDRG